MEVHGIPFTVTGMCNALRDEELPAHKLGVYKNTPTGLWVDPGVWKMDVIPGLAEWVGRDGVILDLPGLIRDGPELVITVLVNVLIDPYDAPTGWTCCFCGEEVKTYNQLHNHFNAVLIKEFAMGEPYPTHPSNRNFLETMLTWGWTVKRNKKDWVIMTHPSGATVQVRPGDYHDGNLSSTFKEVYKATTNGDPSLFWNKPEEEEAKPEPKKGYVPPTSTHDKEPTMEVSEAKAIVTPPSPLPESDAYRGASSVVLDVLIDKAGKPMSTDAMAKETGIPAKVCGNAMSYLASRDLAVRVKRGTYSVNRKLLSSNMHIDHVHSKEHPSQQGPKVQQRPKLEVVPKDEPWTSRDLAPLSPTIPAQSLVDEDTIEDLLDLIAPLGFKAKHLTAVVAWQEATRKLMATLRED